MSIDYLRFAKAAKETSMSTDKPVTIEEIRKLVEACDEYYPSDPDLWPKALKASIEGMRFLLAEVDRLKAENGRLQREARETANDVADEVRWQERQGEDYGTY